MERFAGVPSGQRGKWILVNLQSYTDESGDAATFVVAGFLAPAATWALFSDRWHAVLRDPLGDGKRAPLVRLKTHEAMTRTGEFAGYSPDERDACLRRLADLIVYHARSRIRVVVPMKAYNAVYRGQIAKGMDTPHHLAFNTMMMHVVDHERAPVKFFFDDLKGSREKREIRNGMDVFRDAAPAAMRPFIGGDPEFVPDEKFMPIQAADLLAWHERKAVTLMRTRARKHKDPVWDLLRSLPPIEREWTKIDMRNSLRRTRELAAQEGRAFRYLRPR